MAHMARAYDVHILREMNAVELDAGAAAVEEPMSLAGGDPGLLMLHATCGASRERRGLVCCTRGVPTTGRRRIHRPMDRFRRSSPDVPALLQLCDADDPVREAVVVVLVPGAAARVQFVQ